jgi:hypothetical protein
MASNGAMNGFYLPSCRYQLKLVFVLRLHYELIISHIYIILVSLSFKFNNLCLPVPVPLPVAVRVRRRKLIGLLSALRITLVI